MHLSTTSLVQPASRAVRTASARSPRLPMPVELSGACQWRRLFDQQPLVVLEDGDLVGRSAERQQKIEGGFIKR